MIEADLVQYLRTVPALDAIKAKIFPLQAPKGTPMPYVVVENTGGSRKQMGSKTEEIALFRISVDCGAAQFTAGRNYIEECLKAVENYRGGMLSALDLYISCSSVRGWAGIGDTYRYMFDGEARFMVTTNNP